MQVKPLPFHGCLSAFLSLFFHSSLTSDSFLFLKRSPSNAVMISLSCLRVRTLICRCCTGSKERDVCRTSFHLQTYLQLGTRSTGCDSYNIIVHDTFHTNRVQFNFVSTATKSSRSFAPYGVACDNLPYFV